MIEGRKNIKKSGAIRFRCDKGGGGGGNAWFPTLETCATRKSCEDRGRQATIIGRDSFRETTTTTTLQTQFQGG